MSLLTQHSCRRTLSYSSTLPCSMESVTPLRLSISRIQRSRCLLLSVLFTATLVTFLLRTSALLISSVACMRTNQPLVLRTYALIPTSSIKQLSNAASVQQGASLVTLVVAAILASSPFSKLALIKFTNAFSNVQSALS